MDFHVLQDNSSDSSSSGHGHDHHNQHDDGDMPGSRGKFTQPAFIPLPANMTVNDVRIDQKIVGSGYMNGGIPEWTLNPALTQQSINQGLSATEVTQDVKSINSSAMSINSNLVHMKYLPGVLIGIGILMLIIGIASGLFAIVILGVVCVFGSFFGYVFAHKSALKVYYQRIEAVRNHVQNVINVKYQTRNLSWVMMQAEQDLQGRNIAFHTILIRPLDLNGNPMPGQLILAPGLQMAQQTVVMMPAQQQNIVYVDQSGIPQPNQPQVQYSQPQVQYSQPQQQMQQTQPQQVQYAQPQQQMQHSQPQQVQYSQPQQQMQQTQPQQVQYAQPQQQMQYSQPQQVQYAQPQQQMQDVQPQQVQYAHVPNPTVG